MTWENERQYASAFLTQTMISRWIQTFWRNKVFLISETTSYEYSHFKRFQGWARILHRLKFGYSGLFDRGSATQDQSTRQLIVETDNVNGKVMMVMTFISLICWIFASSSKKRKTKTSIVRSTNFPFYHNILSSLNSKPFKCSSDWLCKS